jgi:hypothetical protein
MSTSIWKKQDNDKIALRRDGVGLMVFNTTFNSISVISWGSVLLMEETGIPRYNH